MLALVLTTPAPGVKMGAILLIPLFVTDGMAIIGLPPWLNEAPLKKSICPPTPE